MNPANSRRLASQLLRCVTVGSLTIVEDGRRKTYGRGAPTATIQVRDERFWPMLLQGSIGLADAYADGHWDSPDLVAVIRVAARNAVWIDRTRGALAPVRWPWKLLRALLTRNTRARSREGIAAHYDLGNELFGHMLDPTMSYSCALFDSPSMSLEDASIAKLELVCAKLELRPEDHLLEIGTGWGALAAYAASTRGCRVTTTTISAEQHDYAVQRIRRAGLENRVTVLLEDYRDLRGRYDKLVSIEMIEAVGWQHWGTFFARCSQLLEPDGCMLLQAITIDDRAYEFEKASRSFINTRIFPGGCLPSLEVIARSLARKTDMQSVHLEDITPHYVETLRVWRDNFNAAADELEALGYDERFRRIWNLYLAYCEGGFAERRICDVQLLAAKPRHRLALSTRRGLVSADPAGRVAAVHAPAREPVSIGPRHRI
jgi:cyclopropane-fatty-acyl-phospholipid synthase